MAAAAGERTSKTKPLRDQSFKLTDAVGRAGRAVTESAAELSIGSFKVASNLFIGVAEGVAKNLTTAVSDSADCAQRGVDRFFSALDSSAGGNAEKNG